MKLRHSIADRVAGFVRDWSLPRQFAGGDPTRGAAQSTMSRQLRPRLEEADTIGTSICPYCAVGCAQLVYAKDRHVIHIEGDPRSPINQGTLCPKGAATFGWLTSPDRLTKVLYRAPQAESWQERPLGWAMDRIAYLVKRTRDETFVRDLPDGTPLNHTLGIASLGGITNCILEHDLWFKQYALAFSNLSTIIDERFKDASELDGFFSGWDEESRSYKYDSWQYQGEYVPASLAEHYVNTTESFA